MSDRPPHFFDMLFLHDNESIDNNAEGRGNSDTVKSTIEKIDNIASPKNAVLKILLKCVGKYGTISIRQMYTVRIIYAFILHNL